MTTFGDRLRRLRKEAGLSQGQLAGQSLSPGYISLLEQGKRTPSEEVVQQLASRLGCSVSQLWSGEPSERERRIELEIAYARLAIEHGEADDARARLESLLSEPALPRRAQDELLLLLGLARERMLDRTGAGAIFQELLDRTLAGECHLPITLVGMVAVRVYLDGGDLNRAIACGEAALGAAEGRHLGGTDDYYRLAATVMAAYMGRGDFLSARLWGQRYLEQARSDGSLAGQAALYWNAAVLEEQVGRVDEALALCERALALTGDLGTIRDTTRLHLQMALLLLQDDPPQLRRSVELLEHAKETVLDLGGKVDVGTWHWLRSAAYLLQGDPEAAESQARQAVELVARGAPLEQSEIRMALADTLAAQGRRDEAVAELRTALSCLKEADPGRGTALSWRDLAERLAALDRPEEAMTAYRHALDGTGVRARNRALAARIRELAARCVVTTTTDTR